ncbi:MAG: PASTA domain-containing protein [Solirubrobacterales bacterium]
MRRILGTIVASLLALGIGVASANADPLSMTFSEGRVNVGSQLSDAPVLQPPDTALFSAQIDPASGAITEGALPVASVSAPITEPIPTVATIEFAVGAVTGTFAESTGALTLSGLAAGTLTAAGGKCTLSTNPPMLTFSTAGNSGGANPRSGTPFTEGLAGPGEIATQWNDMNATPLTLNDVLVCAAFDSRIGGPGGAWLRQGEPLEPPPPGPEPEGGGSGGSGGPGGSGGSGGTGSPGSGSAGTSGGSAGSGSSGDNAAPPSASSTPPPACVVPKLAGKTLARAKAALTAANCTLGEVRKPNSAKGALVVKSSTPAAGAKPASGNVDLRLGPKPKARKR